MDTVNLAITGVFDLVLYLFRHIHAMWGLAAVSAVTGVAMAWVFAKVTNQRKIREVKDRMKAHLLEMWIFRDNMRVVAKAQGQVAWAAARYAACSMRGLAVILVPVALVMIQLQARYGYEPLKAGESSVVTIRLKEATPLDRMNVELEPSAGLVVETPAMRIPEMREVSFRVKAAAPGEHEIGVVLAGERVQKSVSVGTAGCAISPMRASLGADRVFHPVERSLPARAIESVEVGYRPRELSWWGMEFHWLWAFCIVSLAAGFAVKGFFESEERITTQEQPRS
jgi:hypothetical protein